MAISMASFKIMLAAVDFSSPYDHIHYKKFFETFVKNVT